MRITSSGLCWLATGLTDRAADREATVRRRDHGTAFKAGVDEPEEQIAAILDDGQAADLVDDQQARPAKKRMRFCSLPSRPPRLDHRKPEPALLPALAEAREKREDWHGDCRGSGRWRDRQQGPDRTDQSGKRNQLLP